MKNKLDFTYENQGTTNFLVLNLKPDDKVDTVTSGMLTNNKIPSVLPCTFFQMDVQRSFRYNVTSKVTLKSFIAGNVTRKRLLSVMQGIATAIIESEEYMININSFIFDTEYIFVDISRNIPYLVCVPIMREEENSASIGEFIKNIIYGVKFDQSENCDYVAKIISFLNNNNMFSIVDFRSLISGLLSNSEFKNEMVSNPEPIKIEKQVLKEEKQEPVVSINKPLENVSKPSLLKKSEDSLKNLKDKIVKKPEEQLKPKEAPAPNLNLGFEVPKADNLHVPDEQNKLDKGSKKESFLDKILGKKKKETGNFNIKDNYPKAQSPEKPAFQIPLNKERKGFSTPTDGVQKGGNANTSSSFEMPKLKQVKPSINQPKIDDTVLLSGVNNFTEVLETLPYLVRLSTSEKIQINKKIFRLGKAQNYVDYVCPNSHVSRSHADILSKNNEYFIRDNNSTNGTYVNGIRIIGNKEVKIKHEDKIKLANEEFEFRIY